jgi:hypothetical protein
MKITDFKVVYICPDHNEKYHERKVHMDELLQRIGFKNIEHYKSSTENYPDCLTNATIDILKNNLDNPVLILEDDIEWTGQIDFEYNFRYDAIYLGLSKCGGHPSLNTDSGMDSSQFSKWSVTQARVMNMLSAHAILYISKKYKEAVINIFEKHKNQKYHGDVLLTRLQKDFLIVAEKKPFFYQCTKFNPCGHVERCTKIQLE